MNTPETEQDRWFAEHVQPHEQALRRYLRIRFPTLGDVDDLVQEIYIRLIRSREGIEVGNAKAYLFAVGRNAAYDHFRRHRSVFLLEGIAENERDSVLELESDCPEASIHEQQLEILTAAIQALPARCREVITLRKIERLSHAEIADRLGISRHTVNAQVTLGVRRCREYFRSRGLLKGGDHDA